MKPPTEKVRRGMEEIEQYSFGPYGPFVPSKDYQHALAAKYQELQQIREHEFQNGYREAEAIWEEKYKQLMAQALQFARYCDTAYPPTNSQVEEAQAFLKERKS